MTITKAAETPIAIPAIWPGEKAMETGLGCAGLRPQTPVLSGEGSVVNSVVSVSRPGTGFGARIRLIEFSMPQHCTRFDKLYCYCCIACQDDEMREDINAKLSFYTADYP